MRAIATLTTAADAEHRGQSSKRSTSSTRSLSPAERAALVDKVQAHCQVWRQDNHDQQPARRERRGRLAKLPTRAEPHAGPGHQDLGGPPRDAGRTPREFDPKKVKRHVEAFSKTFASDSFDAKSRHVERERRSRELRRGANGALLRDRDSPVLTPEQRTKPLSSKLPQERISLKRYWSHGLRAPIAPAEPSSHRKPCAPAACSQADGASAAGRGGVAVREAGVGVGGRPGPEPSAPLTLLEVGPSPGSEDGSNPRQWWRRRESNPRPEARLRETLQA